VSYELNRPTERLAKNFIIIKIIRSTSTLVITLAILFLIIYGSEFFSFPSWVTPVTYIIMALVSLHGIWSILLEPFFIYKNWRHRVDEDFLQIKSGGINRTYELVPMAKIQSVQTHQGPLLRKYKLYSLTVQTVGSSHHVPALSEKEAIHLREQIAHFAKVKEVE